MKLGIMPTLLKINLIPTPQLKNGAGEGGEHVVYKTIFRESSLTS